MPRFLSQPLTEMFVGQDMVCPYLPDKTEKLLIVDYNHLNGTITPSELNQSGFRRSFHLFYQTICPTCQECLSIRVKTDEFQAY